MGRSERRPFRTHTHTHRVFFSGDLKKNLGKLHEERSRMAQHNVDLSYKSKVFSIKIDELNTELAAQMQKVSARVFLL